MIALGFADQDHRALRPAGHGPHRLVVATQHGEPVRGQPAPTNLADLAEALFGSNGVELEPHPPVEVRAPPHLGS